MLWRNLEVSSPFSEACTLWYRRIVFLSVSSGTHPGHFTFVLFDKHATDEAPIFAFTSLTWSHEVTRAGRRISRVYLSDADAIGGGLSPPGGPRVRREKTERPDISLMGSRWVWTFSVTERADERNSSGFLERFSFLRLSPSTLRRPRRLSNKRRLSNTQQPAQGRAPTTTRIYDNGERVRRGYWRSRGWPPGVCGY